MLDSKNPPIHIWIYNHAFYGISDQIDFCVSAFRQNGYVVSVGRQPKVAALNLVLENFSDMTKDVLINFCQKHKKKVGVVMTEHMNFIDNEIIFHGAPIATDNDYMAGGTQVHRVENLLRSHESIRALFVLGDLPELKNISEMMKGIGVHSIPFPNIELNKSYLISDKNVKNYDVLFTGVNTKYRSQILNKIKNSKTTVYSPSGFVSRNRRNALNVDAKVVLNIPQSEKWNWISSMRVMAALRSGRAAASIGTTDNSMASAACVQLDIKDGHWVEVLKDYIGDWKQMYLDMFENYSSMAEDYSQTRGFPNGVFEYWAITDGL